MEEKHLNVEEILTLAITMEEEGVHFYNAIAAKAQTPVKEELLRLADDEKRHANTFQNLLHKLAKNTEEEGYLFAEEVDAFFHSYTKNKSFDRHLTVPDSLKEAIEIGMETEKITIEYYESLLPYGNEQIIPILKLLIEEEKRHYEKLRSYLPSL